jgi:multidrug resistance efflux pump
MISREYQVMKLGTRKPPGSLKRSLLVLDEVKISGLVPRNAIAPLVGGRDFVSDRLKIEKKVIELDLELLESHLGRFQQLLKTAMVPGDQVDRIQAEIAARKGTIDMIQERLDLRKRLVAGEITAREVEIKDRLAGAEDHYRQARTRVETIKEQLNRLQALEAIGMVSPTEVKQLQYALETAQAELQLAALEKDVLEKIKVTN